MTTSYTNSGRLFKNDRKRSDNDPDYFGTLNVDGVDWKLSAWIKTSAIGRKYFSLAAQNKAEHERQKQRENHNDWEKERKRVAAFRKAEERRRWARKVEAALQGPLDVTG